MKIKLHFFVATFAAINGLRRGPHHPHGQKPVDQKHHHYKPDNKTPLTRQDALLHDPEHLVEHSEVLTAQKLANMTPEEKEFHYFLSHDFDKNTMLDGLELLKAVYHIIDEDTENFDNNTEVKFDIYVEMVDKTLLSDDTNNDGFISYAEYKAARLNRDVSSQAPLIFDTKNIPIYSSS